jgi:hypothetical protein
VTAAPGDCKFQFNPVGTAKFTTSCDIATGFLTRNSVPYDGRDQTGARRHSRRPSRSATTTIDVLSMLFRQAERRRRP